VKNAYLRKEKREGRKMQRDRKNSKKSVKEENPQIAE
jgi:hypothetical protein